MAVLGSGGRLELRREAPSPCVILPGDLNLGSNTIDIACEGYWPGDHVVISGPDGLPITIDGAPQRWDGVATYEQDFLFVAENRDHIVEDDGDFYKQAGNPNNDYFRGNAAFENDNALFYYQGQDEDDEQTTQIDGYLCVDSLGRASLYETRCAGLACCGDSIFEFSDTGERIDFDFIVINQFGSSEYQNAITNCFGELGEYIYNDIAEDDGVNDPDLLLNSICNDPPEYLNPVAGTTEFDNADIQPPTGSTVAQIPYGKFSARCVNGAWSLTLPLSTPLAWARSLARRSSLWLPGAGLLTSSSTAPALKTKTRTTVCI